MKKRRDSRKRRKNLKILKTLFCFPETFVTCNFSSLFVFDELLFELLFVCKGDPGAIQAGAETSLSQ